VGDRPGEESGFLKKVARSLEPRDRATLGPSRRPGFRAILEAPEDRRGRRPVWSFAT
jgi:hypothetical protein